MSRYLSLLSLPPLQAMAGLHTHLTSMSGAVALQERGDLMKLLEHIFPQVELLSSAHLKTLATALVTLKLKSGPFWAELLMQVYSRSTPPDTITFFLANFLTHGPVPTVSATRALEKVTELSLCTPGKLSIELLGFLVRFGSCNEVLFEHAEMVIVEKKMLLEPIELGILLEAMARNEMLGRSPEFLDHIDFLCRDQIPRLQNGALVYAAFTLAARKRFKPWLAQRLSSSINVELLAVLEYEILTKAFMLSGNLQLLRPHVEKFEKTHFKYIPLAQDSFE